MPMEKDSHAELKTLILENTELLKDNNRLLRKIHRNALIEFWVRIFWYVLLIGLPFALYFYVLEPYFTAMGSSYSTFSAGMQELPGWRQLLEFLESVKNAEGS
jgi:membrane protein required for beta-lactamase induction